MRNDVLRERYKELQKREKLASLSAIENGVMCRAYEEARDRVGAQNSKEILKMRRQLQKAARNRDNFKNEILVLNSQLMDLQNHYDGQFELLEEQKQRIRLKILIESFFSGMSWVSLLIRIS